MRRGSYLVSFTGVVRGCYRTQAVTEPSWSLHARASMKASLDAGEATHLVFAVRREVARSE